MSARARSAASARTAGIRRSAPATARTARDVSVVASEIGLLVWGARSVLHAIRGTRTRELPTTHLRVGTTALQRISQ